MTDAPEVAAAFDRPLPMPTPEAMPFWEGTRLGKLMLPACPTCGPFFYPRILCPTCHSRDIHWIEASGRGKLHSFTIAQQPFVRAYRIPPPYVLAMIELDEGPRMMTNLIGVPADPKHLQCDMAVEVVFEKMTDAISVPLFRPAGAGAAKGRARP